MCLQEQRPSGRKGILLFCHSNPELCASGSQWTNHSEEENIKDLKVKYHCGQADTSATH